MMKEKTTKQSDGDPCDERHEQQLLDADDAQRRRRSCAERPPEIATTRPRTQI